jgi:hypothetical protein
MPIALLRAVMAAIFSSAKIVEHGCDMLFKRSD